MLKLFGLKNCDTTKKAIKHLNEHSIKYEFIDIKTVDFNAELLSAWLTENEVALINKRSTTYRQIKIDWEKATNLSEKTAIIQANPTLLKRPILTNTKNEIKRIGYNKDFYAELS